MDGNLDEVKQQVELQNFSVNASLKGMERLMMMKYFSVKKTALKNNRYIAEKYLFGI